MSAVNALRLPGISCYSQADAQSSLSLRLTPSSYLPGNHGLSIILTFH